MKEKLQEYALVAEIISSIAILATLIILIFEMQENTESIQAANIQSIAERTQQYTLQMFNSENAEIIVKSNENELASLTPIERQQLLSVVVTILKIGEESYIQYQNGYLSEEYWLTRGTFVAIAMQSGAKREIYNTLRITPAFISGYIEWVDEAIE